VTSDAFSGRPPERFSVSAPAKINLFLRVVGRRDDGYHELVSLLCPISLADRLDFRFDEPGIAVSCDRPEVPDGPGNLAWRAADRFFRAVGRPGRVSIAIRKRIPAAAGLGGGSTDAAAVLTALNRRFGAPLSPEALHEIAAGLGADVPFFLRAVPALATGVGDRLQPVSGIPPRWVILLAFPFAVSTADVFGSLNLPLTNPPKVTKSLTLADGLFDGNAMDAHGGNDLETVTAARHPEIPAAKRALLAQGAEIALMSGSGPTVFGLFRDPDVARRAGSVLSEEAGRRVLSAKLLVSDERPDPAAVFRSPNR
jgi:4-diphosphocytidyl-2-C-methyl-D-erythritol kinase